VFELNAVLPVVRARQLLQEGLSNPEAIYEATLMATGSEVAAEKARADAIQKQMLTNS
jgi:hypothetical protein